MFYVPLSYLLIDNYLAYWKFGLLSWVFTPKHERTQFHLKKTIAASISHPQISKSLRSGCDRAQASTWQHEYRYVMIVHLFGVHKYMSASSRLANDR